MRFIFILLLTTALASTHSFKDCNFSQFDFFSNYALGKQDELNRTLQTLNHKLPPLPDVTYNSSDLLFRYTITQANSTFYYFDTRQKATVLGDDIITITGGWAQAVLTFGWIKNQKKGTGIALCRTDEIMFAKLLSTSEGFVRFKLNEYRNITFDKTDCNLSRIQPPLQASDIDVLQSMFKANEGRNVKTQLQLSIAKQYESTLNSNLYTELLPINNTDQYTWVDPTPGKKNLTINYTLLPVGAHLQTYGLSLNFVTEITNDDNWKCGATAPSKPKDTKQYGGTQEFLSLSIFENTIRYAVEQGQLHTQLNRQNWQSSVFQFFAGDLYEIIPSIAQKFYADQPITGECNATTSNLKLSKSSDNNLLLSMHYSCALRIANTLISEFEVDPNFVIEIQPRPTHLNFHIVKVNKFAHFKDVGEFAVHDLNIANLFITKCLERLYGGRVFGSGWRIYGRDDPAVEVEEGVVFIYDRAAVE